MSPEAEVTALVLDRARRGDAVAFATVYEAHASRVYALCLRMAASTGDADESMQDVFVRVWRALPAYRGESALATWIHRIAVNTVLERQRSAKRRLARMESADDAMLDRRAARDDATADRLDLEAALHRLTDMQRTVFVLREIEGYDFAEIAELTGIGESTLRSHLFRARAALADLLRE